jgi:hypothetical protein
MTDDAMWQLLMRFEREVITPQRVEMRRELHAETGALRRVMKTNFDKVFKELHSIKAELASLGAAVDRSTSGSRLSSTSR